MEERESEDGEEGIGRHSRLNRKAKETPTHLFVSPRVPHNTNRLHRKEHGKRLTNLIIQPRPPNLLNIDLVRQLQDLHLLPGYWAEDANG